MDIQEQEYSPKKGTLLNPLRPKERSAAWCPDAGPHIPVSNITRASTVSEYSRICSNRLARITSLKTLAYRVYAHSIRTSTVTGKKNDKAACKRQRSNDKSEGIFQRGAPARCKFDGDSAKSDNRECTGKIIPKAPVFPIYTQSLQQGQSKSEESSWSPIIKSRKCEASDIDKGICGNPEDSILESTNSDTEYMYSNGRRKSGTVISQNRGHPPKVLHYQQVGVSNTVSKNEENSLDENHTDICSSKDSQSKTQQHLSSMNQHMSREGVDVESRGSSCSSNKQHDIRIPSELKAVRKQSGEVPQGSDSVSDPPKTSPSVKWKYHCEHCNRKFRFKSQARTHSLTHTGIRPFVCDVCKKTFQRSNHLTDHYRSHSGEKPYVCKVCGKAFARSSNLNNHVHLHTGERRFQCQLCPKTFAESAGLCSHMKMHSGIKPYRCEVCDKAFTHRNQIVPHMRVHTGDKPFQCSICNQSFRQNGHLQSHLKIHRGEKPFECEICHKVFRDRKQLKSHFRVHTGEKNYKCELCSLAFRYRGQLTKHLKSLHSNETPMVGS